MFCSVSQLSTLSLIIMKGKRKCEVLPHIKKLARDNQAKLCFKMYSHILLFENVITVLPTSFHGS